MLIEVSEMPARCDGTLLFRQTQAVFQYIMLLTCKNRFSNSLIGKSMWRYNKLTIHKLDPLNPSDSAKIWWRINDRVDLFYHKSRQSAKDFNEINVTLIILWGSVAYQCSVWLFDHAKSITGSGICFSNELPQKYFRAIQAKISRNSRIKSVS